MLGGVGDLRQTRTLQPKQAAPREPSAAAHAGLASRSAELLIDLRRPPQEQVDDRDPCLAELFFHLAGEQTWATRSCRPLSLETDLKRSGARQAPHPW
jgi:hypothetical protein